MEEPADKEQAEAAGDLPMWEWILVLLVAASVDLGQWLFINLAIVGVFLNWLIDIAFGIAISVYWWLRGIKPTFGKIMAQAAFTGIEALGDGELPFWWLDVALMFMLVKGEKAAKKVASKLPGGELALSAFELKQRLASPKITKVGPTRVTQGEMRLVSSTSSSPTPSRPSPSSKPLPQKSGNQILNEALEREKLRQTALPKREPLMRPGIGVPEKTSGEIPQWQKDTMASFSRTQAKINKNSSDIHMKRMESDLNLMKTETRKKLDADLGPMKEPGDNPHKSGQNDGLDAVA